MPFELSNAATQIMWGLGYIRSWYGSPAAYAHSNAVNWYDQCGFVPPGLSLAYNGTGKPERIPNPNKPDGGGGVTINVTVNGAMDPNAVARQVQTMLLRLKRTNGIALGLA